MDYLSQFSEPRYKKLVFYCGKCRAYRVTYEPDKEKLLTMLLDGIDMDNILSPRKSKELFSDNGIVTSAPLTKDRIVKEAS
jgi:hypothetical protein